MATRLLPRGRFIPIRLVAQTRVPLFVGTFAPERVRFVVDLSDRVSRTLYFQGAYESPMTAVFLECLRDSTSVIDVGANFGYYTLLAASRLKGTGIVHALEPEPENFRRLNANVALNGFSAVRAWALAAAAEPGTLRILSDSINREKAATVPLSHASGKRVGVTSLDRLRAETGAHMIDLVKMDIEGGEVGAVRGMEKGLRSHSYKRILLEFHPELIKRRGENPASVFEPFVRAGYRRIAIRDRMQGLLGHYSTRFRSDLLDPDSKPPPDAGPPRHYLLTAPGAELRG